MQIKDIMTKTVVCANPDDPIVSIAKKMRDENIGAIPVCNSREVIGVITDRDIVTRAIAKGVNFAKFTVKDIMTRTPFTARDNETVEDAVHLMENKRVRRLPVLDQAGKLVGLISLDDIATNTSHELSGEALEALSFAKKQRQTKPEFRI